MRSPGSTSELFYKMMGEFVEKQVLVSCFHKPTLHPPEGYFSWSARKVPKRSRLGPTGAESTPHFIGSVWLFWPCRPCRPCLAPARLRSPRPKHLKHFSLKCAKQFCRSGFSHRREIGRREYSAYCQGQLRCMGENPPVKTGVDSTSVGLRASPSSRSGRVPLKNPPAPCSATLRNVLHWRGAPGGEVPFKLQFAVLFTWKTGCEFAPGK